MALHLPKLRVPAQFQHTTYRSIGAGRLNYSRYAGVATALLLLVLVGASDFSLTSTPEAGVYITALAFAILVGIALWKDHLRELAISVAIIPLAFMIGLSLPQGSPFALTVVFNVTLLVLASVYRYLFTLDVPRDITKLRMTRHGYLFAIPMMVIVGQFFGAIGYGLLRHQYDFQPAALPLVFAAALVFAISEEVLLRGLIQQRAGRVMHPVTAAVLSAGLSAFLTFGQHGGTLTPIFGLIMGLALSYVYYRKQNLLLTIALNASTKMVYLGLVAIFILRP